MEEKAVNYEQKVSVMFSVAKFFALISIVCAHTMLTETSLYEYIWRMYCMLGTVGVICYLFISAYYFNATKFKSIFALIKNKAVNLGIPWLILGSAAFLYRLMATFIKSRSVGSIGEILLSYLKWMIGNGSYLYYMTILFLCYLIFYKTNKYVLFGAIGINIVSLVLTASGVLAPVMAFLHINNYLNIFNWIGIFALGMLFRNVDKEKLYGWIVKVRYIAIPAFIVVTVVLFIFNVEVTYFSYVGIWYELLGMVAFFGASTFKPLQNRLIMDISNASFAIYLSHMIIIGILDKLYNIHFITQMIAVFVVIAVTYLCLWCVRAIAKKLKIDKQVNIMLGIRERKLK